MKLLNCKQILIGVISFLGLNTFAQEEKLSVRESGSTLENGLSMVIEDDKYQMIVDNQINFEDLDEAVYLELGVDDLTLGSVPVALNFSATATFSVTPYQNNGQPSPTSYQVTLQVEHLNPELVESDLAVHKVPGCHKAEIVLESITVSSGVVVPENLYVELSFETDRYYELGTVLPVTGINLIQYVENLTTGEYNEVVIPGTVTSSFVNDIEVYWGYLQGAREYELEWCWIDNYASDGGERLITSIDLTENDFRMNNTRIRTTDQFYRIPALFDKGYLVYRVRAVGRWMQSKPTDKFGKWSTDGSPKAKVSDWTNHIVKIGHNHQELMNWQYQATYAEGGKRKDVISYFDGSMRNRQTVTRMNTQYEAIVGESMYDNQGRAAIQVLPTPVNSPVLGYYPDLNRNMSNTVYTHLDFDWETMPDPQQALPGCGSIAQAMLEESGASKYYSPNNGIQNNWQDRVPDAQQYPFSRVEYTPDNTGRVRKQSGVGPDHMIGSGHETQYFYLQPSQEELNRLFGYKVGNKSRYKKNMVVDANGQVSVSYLDPQGRVIATAIEGGNPDMFDALKDEGSLVMHRQVRADVLNKSNQLNPDDDFDDNNRSITGRFGSLEDKLSVSSEIGVSQNNLQYVFDYTATSGSYTDPCLTAANICYPYVYDLDIHLVDDCGQERLVTPVEVKVEPPTPYTFSDCQNVDFTALNMASTPLEIGSYSLTKNIQVNEEAYLDYLEHYLESGCLLTLNDFYVAPIEEDCYTSCEECVQSLGDWESYRNVRLEAKEGVDISLLTPEELTTLLTAEANFVNQLEKEYATAQKLCMDPCRVTTACESLRATMLTDVSPNGQYGKVSSTDFSSVFNDGANNFLSEYQISNTTNWRNPYTPYANEAGLESFVRVTWDEEEQQYFPAVVANAIPAGNPMTIDVKPEHLLHLSDFVELWEPSWANSLLPYHPESCYLDYYDMLCATAIVTRPDMTTLLYDAELRDNINTFEQATSLNVLAVDLLDGDQQGWNILTNDPFYQLDLESGFSYLTYSAKQSFMLSVLNNYKGTGRTLKQYALELAVCGSAANSPGCTGVSWTDPGLTVEQKDRAWQIFKSEYISFRSDVISLFADMYALRHGCFNSCIGEDETNLFSAILNYSTGAMVVIMEDLITDEVFHQLAFNPYQLCDYSSVATPTGGPTIPEILYANKDPRIIRGDALYDSSPGTDLGTAINNLVADIDYATWQATGACPLTTDMKLFLNGLTSEAHQSFWNNIPLSSVNLPELSFDLYTALTGLSLQGNPPVQISATVQSQTLSVDLGAASSCLDLTLPTSWTTQGYTWTNIGQNWTIVSFGDVYYIPDSYSSMLPYNQYNFKVVARIRTSPTAPLIEVVLDGVTCAGIGECGVGVQPPHQSLPPDTEFGCNEKSYNQDIEQQFEAFLNEFLLYTHSLGGAGMTEFTSSNMQVLSDFFDLGDSEVLGITNIHFDQWGGSFYFYNAFDTLTSCPISLTCLSETTNVQNFTPSNSVVLPPCESFSIADILYFSNAAFGNNRISIKAHSATHIYQFEISLGCLKPFDCPCIPQTVAPVSCTEKWSTFSTAITTQVTDYVFPNYLDETYFCTYNLQYVSDDYLYYLSALNVQSTDDLDYLTIGEFGNTNLGYGHVAMQSVIDDYVASTHKTSWQVFANAKNDELIAAGFCPPAPAYIPFPEIEPVDDCFRFQNNVASANAMNQYEIYLEAVKDAFRETYVKGAISSLVETFHQKHDDKQYHYTLYYYDQAGNLVQTVPPQGVKRMSEEEVDGVLTALDEQQLEAKNLAINTKRITNPLAEDSELTPGHTLQTQYRYNSLNQLVWQRTPDGGESRFAYDQLGRMVVSQNAKQRTELESSNREKYSYTRYDALGRVVEVGEMILQKGLYAISSEGQFRHFDPATGTYAEDEFGFISPVYWYPAHDQDFPNNILNNERNEVTHTVYDELPLNQIQGGIPNNPVYYFEAYASKNTRNRIVGVTYQENYYPNPWVAESSIRYDYDVHGNVKEQLVNVKDEGWLNSIYAGSVYRNHFSTLYDYDLVSGNVKQVTYQKGKPEQFIHRYQYDADNRITEVETSSDGYIWENDASYFYYDHGPLARTEIGDRKVQGLDYAYTIQGWIKGVNSEELSAAYDMGYDGGEPGTLPASVNSQSGRDAFGYSLSYFEGDYKPRITGADNFLTYTAHAGYSSTSQNLYNGNIRDVFTAIMKDDETPLGTYNYQYQYDQLNRIKRMNSRSWSVDNVAILPTAGLFETTYNYDRNGNLTGLRRWADNGTTKTAMDEFTYDYITGTNKLAAVHDAVSAGNFTEDLDDQPGQYAALGFAGYSLANETTHNYRYDAIGQLVQDKTEEIENIEWTVTGKVKKIERYAFSEKPDLVFTYDPMGQRISKTVYPKSAPGVIDASGIEKKYYIRDAQGNELVRYGIEQGTESGQDVKILLLEERTIYGSSRLGMERIGEEVARSYVPVPDDGAVSMRSGLYVPGEELMRQVGDKRYELSNHLGNVLATVSDRKLAIAEAGAVYANDFTSDIDGVNAYLGGSVSHSGGRLRVTTTSQGSGAVLQYVATVPGQTYRLQLTADLAGQGSVAITAYDVPTATVTAQKVMSSNGVHYLDFLASSSTTQLRMQSQVSGTRTFYIDDLTLEKRPSVFARDLTASYADIQTYGTGVTASISGNRLRVDNLGQWNGILCVFPTVAGRTYTVHYTLGLNGGPKLTPFVRNNITSANIQVQHITSDGRYTLTFVAPSSETMFAVENPNTGTRSMYLSYLFVQDVNAAAVVEDFYYVADVKSYSDYMPFGMQMPNRNGSTDDYRYGFQGQEKDDEVFGSEGTSYTADFWQYDSRLGRRWNRDPKPNPSISNYACFANSPLLYSDPYGDTLRIASGQSQEFIDKYNKAIDELKQTTRGLELYNNLQNAKEDFIVREYDSKVDKSENYFKPNKMTIIDANGNITEQFNPGGLIVWDKEGALIPVQKDMDKTTSIGAKGLQFSLYHEMAHAEDHFFGNLQQLDNSTIKDLKESEWSATFTENEIRAEMNAPLRTHYFAKPDGTGLFPSLIKVNSIGIQTTYKKKSGHYFIKF